MNYRDKSKCSLLTAFVVIISATSLSAKPTFATAVHEVSWSNGCTSDGLQDIRIESSMDGSSVAIAGSGSSTFNGCSNSGGATVGAGFISVSLDSDTTAGDESRGYGGAATYNLEARYGGITVTPTGGGPNGIVPMAIAFSLSGSLGGSIVDVSGLPGMFDSSLGFSVVVSGAESGVGILAEQFEVGTVGGICPPQGCFDSLNGTFVTETFDFDTSKSLSVTINLSASVNTLSYFGGMANAEVNAANTFNFREIDAFILPTGYVVNFSEAGIENNNWVGPQPIPIPASLYLLASGLILVMRRFS